MTEMVQQEKTAVTRKLPRPGFDETRVEKLRRVADACSANGPFSIFIAQIDPDAIGSAFGMQEVLSVMGHTAHIYYQGRVGHPQNEMLCSKLGLTSRMRPIPVPDEHGPPDVLVTNVVLVDSSKKKDSRLPFELNPVIVVDHHEKSDIKDSDDIFLWLDESAGSASTMVAEILSEITPEKWEFKSDLALMLALGIYTDCKSNTRSGERDDQAYAWVKRYTDNATLADLVNYKRKFSFLEHLARAVAYVKKYDTYRKGRILAGLGRIPEKSGDDLAMVADELLRTVGAPLAVTWAMVEVKSADTGETTVKIRVCARSEDYTTNLGETLSARFGDKSGAKSLPDGSAEGGALFELPGMGPWLKDDEMEEIVNRRIIEWFYDQKDTGTTDS
ncbi:MAG: bifunctional oligoribonuclease/PAP phosphatase NrnA [Nitrospira sp.]